VRNQNYLAETKEKSDNKELNQEAIKERIVSYYLNNYILLCYYFSKWAQD